jgi:PAS domain-containing protein
VGDVHHRLCTTVQPGWGHCNGIIDISNCRGSLHIRIKKCCADESPCPANECDPPVSSIWLDRDIAIIFIIGLVIGRLHDIGEKYRLELETRHKVEKDLKDKATEIQGQREYFEALVHNSPIAIVALNIGHNVIACNPAFEKLFGYSESEIVGKELDGLITSIWGSSPSVWNSLSKRWGGSGG